MRCKGRFDVIWEQSMDLYIQGYLSCGFPLYNRVFFRVMNRPLRDS